MATDMIQSSLELYPDQNEDVENVFSLISTLVLQLEADMRVLKGAIGEKDRQIEQLEHLLAAEKERRC